MSLPEHIKQAVRNKVAESYKVGPTRDLIIEGRCDHWFDVAHAFSIAETVMTGIVCDGALYSRSGGMSLRDWFAGQIAGGMAAFSGTSGISYGPGEIAGRAYQVADALVAARTQEQPK